MAKAKLRHRACVEDIDFRQPRGLDRALLRSRTQDWAWVREQVATVSPSADGFGPVRVAFIFIPDPGGFARARRAKRGPRLFTLFPCGESLPFSR